MIKMLWCNAFFSDGLKKKTRESDLVTVKHPELFFVRCDENVSEKTAAATAFCDSSCWHI